MTITITKEAIDQMIAEYEKQATSAMNSASGFRDASLQASGAAQGLRFLLENATMEDDCQPELELVESVAEAT